MDKKVLIGTLAGVFSFVLFFLSAPLRAATFVVGEEFVTIQDAINAFSTRAVAGDEIVIKPGTYPSNNTIAPGTASAIKMVIRGEETKTTILHSINTPENEQLPIFRIDNATVEIRNLTFVNSLRAIEGYQSTVNVFNNVFAMEDTVLSTGDVAIFIDSLSLTTIKNNTFYRTNTAISISNTDGMKIHNNMFFEVSALIGQQVDLKFNGVFNSAPIIIDSLTIVCNDPLYVNTETSPLDFHLKEDSLCIDKGNPEATDNDKIDNSRNDIGAYGGPSADPRPAVVTEVSATKLTDTSLSVTWTPNLSYHVTNTQNPGAYKIYYGQKPGPDYAPEPKSVDATQSTATIDGLAIPDAIQTPTITELIPGDQTIKIKWTKVDLASGYTVHYGTQSTADNAVDAGDKSSYTFENLENGVTYYFAVSAYLQPRYYVAIKTVDNTSTKNTSDFSAEVAVDFGDTLTSALSAEQSEFAEPLLAYPLLPNEGCFIATAAFGYYSAPQVQILRDFRDRFLLHNYVGKLFVKWYYANGPIAAELMRDRPIVKASVRWLLAPVILVAYLFLNGWFWILIPGLVLSALLLFGRQRVHSLLRSMQNAIN